jgi:hypothetical protein
MFPYTLQFSVFFCSSCPYLCVFSVLCFYLSFNFLSTTLKMVQHRSRIILWWLDVETLILSVLTWCRGNGFLKETIKNLFCRFHIRWWSHLIRYAGHLYPISKPRKQSLHYYKLCLKDNTLWDFKSNLIAVCVKALSNSLPANSTITVSHDHKIIFWKFRPHISYFVVHKLNIVCYRGQ